MEAGWVESQLQATLRKSGNWRPLWGECKRYAASPSFLVPDSRFVQLKRSDDNSIPI